MNVQYKNLIAQELRDCVRGTIERILHNERTQRPFHAALLSEEVLFWSAVERSFSTSFGQRVIEEVARLVVLSNGATEAQRQKVTLFTIDNNLENAIHEHIQSLRSRNSVNNTLNAMIQITQNTPLSGTTCQIRVISDLWWIKDGIEHYISLKTVKPNIDQTAVAKEDCLHLLIANPQCRVYFGLAYNPYGDNREAYNFNPPMGIFNFRSDPVVLIGRDLWDTLGGAGCYDELMQIFSEVGAETQALIRKLRNQ